MSERTPFSFNEWQRQFPNSAAKRGAASTSRDFLAKHRACPRITCADGFTMSVQASEFHYCAPRQTDCPSYTRVEVGFPSEAQPELMEWAEDADKPTETVYGWVPVEVVDALIEKHGGLQWPEGDANA